MTLNNLIFIFTPIFLHSEETQMNDLINIDNLIKFLTDFITNYNEIFN